MCSRTMVGNFYGPRRIFVPLALSLAALSLVSRLGPWWSGSWLATVMDSVTLAIVLGTVLGVRLGWL